METTLSLIAILIFVLLIGFVAGLEIAFVSANKLSLELNKKQGTYAGKIWGIFAEQPAKFIGSLLVVSTILLVIYGLLIGKILFPFWHFIEVKLPASSSKYVNFIKLFIETIASTAIILIVIFLSKAIFHVRNKNIMNSGFIAYLGNLVHSLFASISNMFVGMAGWILKYVFNVKVSEKNELFSNVDVEHYAQQNKMHNEEDSSEINKELFENALSLSEVRIRECLVPRKEIVGISKSSTMAEVKKLFIETQLSKLVVFDNNIDTIIGYIHQLDLFKGPNTIDEIMLPIPTVPETMSATDLMAKFSKERKSIAWVIDEFGGTAGIVTMEDLLEEIFGDIKDEYDDVDEFVDKQLSETEYLFSGRMELDLITQKYGLVFSDEESAETLSGYIVQHNENLPKEKEQIIVGNYEFSIMSMSDTRIETVKLKVLRRS
jgi:putative hemolysin